MEFLLVAGLALLFSTVGVFVAMFIMAGVAFSLVVVLGGVLLFLIDCVVRFVQWVPNTIVRATLRRRWWDKE